MGRQSSHDGEEMKCKLDHFRLKPNAVELVSRCSTHDWDFGQRPQSQCPIGRIEEAADKAIEKIREERARHPAQFG